MATQHRETESKFLVDVHAPVPDLSTAEAVARVGDPVVTDLEATYFDTPHRRLARRNITMRRRTGSADAGWHVKVPSGNPQERVELQLPDHGETGVPTELVDEVRAFVRDESLSPIATLRTHRTERHLYDTSGVDLAVVADDVVDVQGTGTQSPWREIEVELVDGPAEVLESCSRVLISAGLQPSSYPSKLHHAIGDLGAGPDRDETLDGSASAGDVLLRHLREQVDELLIRDREARADAPDGVHKMRVATRRLRSALATYRPILRRELTDPIRDELKWLGGLLGDPRDAEVLRDRLDRAARELPPELSMGPVLDRVHAELSVRHSDAHDRLLVGLAEARYFRLLDQLEELIGDPPFEKRATRSAEKELTRLVRRSDRRVHRAALVADEQTDDAEREHALHDVRKAAKRARYAAESAEIVLGKRASKLATRMEDLQDLLGEVQDSVTSRLVLRDLGRLAFLANENGFTFGLLHERERCEADHTLTNYPKLRRRADNAAKRL